MALGELQSDSAESDMQFDPADNTIWSVGSQNTSLKFAENTDGIENDREDSDPSCEDSDSYRYKQTTSLDGICLPRLYTTDGSHMDSWICLRLRLRSHPPAEHRTSHAESSQLHEIIAAGIELVFQCERQNRADADRCFRALLGRLEWTD
eukprot:TRINITY_DN111292_c0_g1_i1.p1 TRINITY_DN111292_c0_g1~~TRINITY_DN111292_c0_g1_i1.p1  ORF type:complete len:172 (+),score=8.79 TRINITY_DN111292_c0_g1_i1:69-518(+)